MIYFILLWSRKERNRKKQFSCCGNWMRGRVPEVPFEGALNNPRLQRCFHGISTVEQIIRMLFKSVVAVLSSFSVSPFLKGDPGQPGETGLMVSLSLSHGLASLACWTKLARFEKLEVMEWEPQSLWQQSCSMLPSFVFSFLFFLSSVLKAKRAVLCKQ